MGDEGSLVFLCASLPPLLSLAGDFQASLRRAMRQLALGARGFAGGQLFDRPLVHLHGEVDPGDHDEDRETDRDLLAVLRREHRGLGRDEERDHRLSFQTAPNT